MGKPHNIRLFDQHGKAWFATEELVVAAAVFANEGTTEHELYYKLEDGRKLIKLPDGTFQTDDGELTLTTTSSGKRPQSAAWTTMTFTAIRPV